jgi:hypothetical protein
LRLAMFLAGQGALDLPPLVLRAAGEEWECVRRQCQ